MKKMLVIFSMFIIYCSSTYSQQITKDELLLEAIGAFSGQNMYLTYLSLGNIADSYASGVYTNEFAIQITAELSEMIAMTIGKYNEMLSSKLIFGDDYNRLDGTISCYFLPPSSASVVSEEKFRSGNGNSVHQGRW